MKNIFWCLGLLAMLMVACSEEFENVNSTPNLPETSELVTANIQGTISNFQGIALDSITVDILVDGAIVGTTTSLNGEYSFRDQPAHNTKTILRAHSKSIVPSFNKVEVTSEAIMQSDFTLVSFEDIIVTDDNDFVYNSADGTVITFEDDYLENVDKVILGFKTFSFPFEDEEIFSITEGIDKEGNAVVVDLQEVLYLGAYNFDDETAILKTEKNHVISFPISDGQSIWSYQIIEGVWKEVVDFEIIDNSVNISTNEFTFFTYSGAQCINDTEPPTAICSDYTLDLNDSYILNPNVINNGSFDNCSDTLMLSFTKAVDVCDNVIGSVFCNEESGQDILCTLLVKDEAFNSSTCDFTVSVIGMINCPDDTTTPIPICQNLPNVLLQGDNVTLLADDFDAGSFDNCSTILDFKVRKLVDLCNNGSDTFNDTVEFCLAELDSQVTLRVMMTDENGNSDFCDVFAEIKN